MTGILQKWTQNIPGLTKSDKPKSMAFSSEFSSLVENKKF